MKHLPLFVLLLSLVLFANCKKASNGNGSLAGIIDSAGKIQFNYSAGRISSAYRQGRLSTPSGEIATFDYFGDNYIKITGNEPNSIQAEITLNDSGLPTHMIKRSPGLSEDTVTFYYRPGTFHVDSAILSGDPGIGAGHMSFTCQYDGDNIAKIIVSNGTVPDSITFAYQTNVPNIYRASDRLFYIYSDFIFLGPLSYSGMSYEGALHTLFFARAFSGSTLASYSYTFGGVHFDGNYVLLTANDKVIGEHYAYSFSQGYFYN